MAKTPPRPTLRLIKFLGLGGLAYLLVGLAISRFVSGPSLQVVIDRSYCPPSRWQQVAADYTELYQQHQQRQLTIESVTLVNELGEEQLAVPPSAAKIASLNTFGLSGRDRINTILQTDPEARVLTCQP
ncbi:MAG: hypothetical protein F6J97_09885 [Leptolyngbya sp. SIO4C1]|nr:hypothetical protein [Leptolyngbya sp. SIO4C1]